MKYEDFERSFGNDVFWLIKHLTNTIIKAREELESEYDTTEYKLLYESDDMPTADFDSLKNKLKDLDMSIVNMTDLIKSLGDVEEDISYNQYNF